MFGNFVSALGKGRDKIFGAMGGPRGADDDMPGGGMGMLPDDSSDVELPPSRPQAQTWRPPMAPDQGFRGVLSSEVNKTRPVGPMATPTAPPAMGAGAPQSMASTLDRRGVALPSLRGETAGPQEWSEKNEKRYDKMGEYLKGIPGAGSDDPISKARYDYNVAGLKRDGEGRLTDKTDRGGWKGFLQNAGLGAIQGLASGQGLGGAVGGALTGGAAGLIAPQMARDARFSMLKEPQMMRDEGRAAQQMQRQRQMNQDARQARIDAAADVRNQQDTRIRGIDEQLKQKQLDTFGQDKYTSTTWGSMNTRTGQPGYVKPATPSKDTNSYQYTDRGIMNRGTGDFKERWEPGSDKPMTREEAMAQVQDEDDGKSFQEIGEESWQGRREGELKSKLSPRDYGIIAGTVTDAEPSEVSAAYQRMNQIDAAGRASTISGSRNKATGRANAKRAGNRPAGPSASPGGNSSTTRSRSSLADRFRDIDLTP